MARSKASKIVGTALVVAAVFAGTIVYRSRQRSTLAVRTVRVARQEIHAGVVTNGKSEPIRFQDARAEIEGEVSQVLVR